MENTELPLHKDEQTSAIPPQVLRLQLSSDMLSPLSEEWWASLDQEDVIRIPNWVFFTLAYKALRSSLSQPQHVSCYLRSFMAPATSPPPLSNFASGHVTMKVFGWHLNSRPRTCTLAFYFRWLLLAIRKIKKETWQISWNGRIFWRTWRLETWVLDCQQSEKLCLLSLSWVSSDMVIRGHGAHFIWL